MTTPLRFYVCSTRLGWIGLLLSDSGLRATTLPQRNRHEALRRMLELGGEEEACLKDVQRIVEMLQSCAKGESVDCHGILDWSAVTPFQRKVLEETLQIPAGETRTYGWLAARAGSRKAARAVGQVMAKNPWPIIVPCHRVVASDASLHGYGGGLRMKQTLLSKEGLSKPPRQPPSAI